MVRDCAWKHLYYSSCPLIHNLTSTHPSHICHPRAVASHRHGELTVGLDPFQRNVKPDGFALPVSSRSHAGFTRLKFIGYGLLTLASLQSTGIGRHRITIRFHLQNHINNVKQAMTGKNDTFVFSRESSQKIHSSPIERKGASRPKHINPDTCRTRSPKKEKGLSPFLR